MRMIDLDFLEKDLARAEAILQELQPQVKRFHSMISEYLEITKKRREDRETK